ncbi:hypothetical protein G7Y89_g911 [Cudoniella acicularis]|uniref:DNA-directed RNA polymerase III subunit RPC9 n=1 Tax=Cudoniella acicularis TaxID=354080 RepID=A0A8H4RWA7_9HELO|nr:hypothetical protein G7Y89_g911 [Cudoniella acicularis]
MKILEAQAATLTNYEVYTHLVDQRVRHEKLDDDERSQRSAKKEWKHRRQNEEGRRPGNLNTLRKELLEYLCEAPSPLGSKPFPYGEQTIRNLLEALRPWDLTKGEVIMIVNLRPTKLENLNVIIEQMDDRFPEEDQVRLLHVIAEVLGRPNQEAERQAMTDNAKEARNKVQEAIPLEDLEMNEAS